MKSGEKKFAYAVLGTLTLALIFAAPTLVRAQSSDPFDKDTTDWKSFDRYKEEEKARLFSTMTGDIEADKKAAAKTDAEEDNSDSVTIKKPSPSETQEATKDNITPPVLDASGVAAPERPITPPIMPGVNPNPPSEAAASDDDTRPAARVVNVDSAPTLQLQKQNWMDAVRAAKEGQENRGPLNVRMTFLPGMDPLHKKTATKIAAVTPPPPVIKKEEPKKSAADVAACAAIDAYKKRQLAAIQSDRETLAALQTAIKQLGLEQKLDYMTDANGTIGTTADKSVLMDMPSAAGLNEPALPAVAKP